MGQTTLLMHALEASEVSINNRSFFGEVMQIRLTTRKILSGWRRLPLDSHQRPNSYKRYNPIL